MPQSRRTAGGRAIPRVSAGQAYLGLGSRKNQRMPPDYAKDLAYLMQVDPRDKAEMDKARKALEKAMRNIVSAGADYEAVLAELSKAQKASVGKDGKPRDLKELKEMRQELKEVLTTINKLSKKQATSDEELATLSPLMKKVAESISAIKMGQLGTADLQAALAATGAGKKTDVDGLAKIYKKNTELARKDWHTFMSQALKLQQSVGSRKGELSKEMLTPFLGSGSPTVHTLKEMLGEEKSFYSAVKEYWTNSVKENAEIRKATLSQNSILEEQVRLGQAAYAQTLDSLTQQENDGTSKANEERMYREESSQHDKKLLAVTKEIKSLLEDLNATGTAQQILMTTLVAQEALDTGGGGGPNIVPTGGGWQKLKDWAKKNSKNLKRAGVAGVAAVGVDYALGKAKENTEEGSAANTAASTAQDVLTSNTVIGAGVGATVGSVVPVVGTALGAGAGALVGGALDIYDYTKSRETNPFRNDYDTDPSEKKKYASVDEVLNSAAGIAGVDPGLLKSMAFMESGLGTDVKGTGNARGIMQIMPGTWRELVGKYGNGKKSKGGKRVDVDIEDIDDPWSNAVMGAFLIRDNAKALTNAKLPITADNLYTLHFMGPSGGITFLRGKEANPNAAPEFYKGLSKEQIAKTQKDNAAIYYKNGKDASGGLRSSGEVAGLLHERMSKASILGTALAPHIEVHGKTQMGAPVGANMVLGANYAQATKEAVARTKAGPSVDRATPVMPTAAPTQQATAPAPAVPLGAASQPPVSIDSIPMFVDDTGLMLISVGGLV